MNTERGYPPYLRTEQIHDLTGISPSTIQQIRKEMRTAIEDGILPPEAVLEGKIILINTECLFWYMARRWSIQHGRADKLSNETLHTNQVPVLPDPGKQKETVLHFAGQSYQP